MNATELILVAETPPIQEGILVRAAVTVKTSVVRGPFLPSVWSVWPGMGRTNSMSAMKTYSWPIQKSAKLAFPAMTLIAQTLKSSVLARKMLASG